MAGPTNTRQIGQACRIYKNADAKVIAMDAIAVNVDTRRITMDTFHHSASMKYHRTLFHLGVGDRTVALIQMIGDYTDLSEDSGNYLTATWDSADNTNDIKITFNTLAKLGDTV